MHGGEFFWVISIRIDRSAHPLCCVITIIIILILLSNFHHPKTNEAGDGGAEEEQFREGINVEERTRLHLLSI